MVPETAHIGHVVDGEGAPPSKVWLLVNPRGGMLVHVRAFDTLEAAMQARDEVAAALPVTMPFHVDVVQVLVESRAPVLAPLGGVHDETSPNNRTHADSSFPTSPPGEAMTPERFEPIAWADGIFVGMLNADEIALFDEAVEQGIAHRSYEGAGGFMGLAKVRFNRESQ